MSNETTQEDIDEIWRKDGEVHGWQLPPPAHGYLRSILIVRLIRAAFLEKRARNKAVALKKQGIGLGTPPQQELWVIYAISRGWC
jgi:hypothetical protein